jgi:signal peptidase I
MPRPAHARSNDDELEDERDEEDEEEDEEEEPAPRRRVRYRSRPVRHRKRPEPVKRWRASETDEEEEEPEVASRSGRPSKKPIYWRARDSLFFEPLVALAIVVLLLVSLFAFTQNWPPLYVVESDSMQHGSADQLGLINTGDLVLAQKVSLSTIVPYVTGLQTGYSTYGEYGDVLLYWPNGQGSTPVIHRALLYLDWDPLGFYNATDLAGLPCGNAPNAVYATPGTPQNCGTTHLTSTLDLYRIGWMSLNVSLDLSAPALGRHSGFLTMGDNNTVPDQAGAGVAAISSLVEAGWIIGVARGMIPWFGALKLLLQGQAGEVPPQSWEFLGLTVAGIILAAFGIHYALRTEGIETPLRREEEEEARTEAEAAPEGSGPRRWFSWFHRRRSEEEEDGEAAEEPAPRHRTRPSPSPTGRRRGRPVPHVRRGKKPAKKSESDEEL